MRKIALLAYFVFLSLQIHAAQHEQQNDIQANIKLYENHVNQLSDITKKFMNKLQVCGRDYSKFVLKQKSEIEATKYYAEQYVLQTLNSYTKQIKNAYNNDVNRFFVNDKANGCFYSRFFSRQKIQQDANEQMMQELQTVQQHLSDVYGQISEFFDFPIECLRERNDCYVSCWFDLRSVRDALEIPEDRMTPEQVITHFQGVDKTLTDLSTTLTEYREFQSAFLTSSQIFQQEMNIMGDNWLFECTVVGETLIQQIINEMRQATIFLYELKSVIESCKPSETAAPKTTTTDKKSLKRKPDK